MVQSIGVDIVDIELKAHELDGYWYLKRNDEQLLRKVKENLIDFFHEFLEVNSS